jgi:hypothetical protein
MMRSINQRTSAGVALGIAVLGLHLAGLPARAADPDDGLRARLVGTWRMMSKKENGVQSPLPATAVTYKHITPVGFMWLSHEKGTGKVFRAAGGTYTLHGDAYKEKVEYGFGEDFGTVKDAEHSFTCRIEGDRWYHTGKLANGTTIEEVWERVAPAQGGAH